MRSYLRSLPILALGGVVLAACVTVPVVVRNDRGLLLRGSASATMLKGTYSVTDGKLTCDGTYSSWNMSRTIQMPVTCSDGRTGTVIATRDEMGLNGKGTITLNDGTTAEFYFGQGADWVGAIR